MHYLKCYTFLFLMIPTLFLAGLSSSVSFGATDKPQIITPSKIICCKDDTSTSSDSASTSLASPLKKISTKPTQHDEAVETEKTDSTSTSLASPLKKINTDEKKIITPSKIICCKDDTSTSSDSASTSLASPLKKISTKPTQHDEAVETEKTDSASTSLASPLKKISTKPTQHDEAVETEKTDSASTSLASPLKKVSTKPTQHDEAVETEKTDSASTSLLASPLKKINTDEKKIITPSKIICCKDDTSDQFRFHILLPLLLQAH